jgi:hypothetical protein
MKSRQILLFADVVADADAAVAPFELESPSDDMEGFMSPAPEAPVAPISPRVSSTVSMMIWGADFCDEETKCGKVNNFESPNSKVVVHDWQSYQTAAVFINVRKMDKKYSYKRHNLTIMMRIECFSVFDGDEDDDDDD